MEVDDDNNRCCDVCKKYRSGNRTWDVVQDTINGGKKTLGRIEIGML